MALRWELIAAAQDGVLARRQALRAGMPRTLWDSRLQTGRWCVAGRGVAFTHAGTPTPRQWRWAAALAGGPRAALTGDVALVEHGVRRVPLRTYDVALPGDQHLTASLPRAPHPLVLRRIAVLAHVRQPGDDLPCVTPHVAALHAAAWAPTDRAAELRVVLAVQQRVTAVPLLRSALDLLPALPRRGVIRVVLGEIEGGAQAASELEFLRFCRRHGLPLPDALQVRVRAGGTRYLDGRYARQRVALEVDGAYHLWAETWNADALRSLHLAVAARGTGEQVLRVTTTMLRYDAAVTADLLRALLA